MLDSVHLEIVLNLTQDRGTVCAEHSAGSENHFGCTRWNSKVTWIMWNLILAHLEIVLGSVQDRCMVSAKHTVGSEIILDAPDGTPR
jgi:hypothetical protein